MGPISIRLEAEVKEALQELAEADERSLSSFVNGILRNYVEAAQGLAHADRHKPSRRPELACLRASTSAPWRVGFPTLPAQIMAALQDATAAAERKVLRPH